MSFKNYKFKRLKEYIFSIISIIIILLVKNLYDNGIIVEVFLRTFKHKLSLISLKQSQSVRLQQQLCQLPTSTVFYQVPDMSSIDRLEPPPPSSSTETDICVTRTLLELEDRSLGFLLETSNRSSLSVRQGCAVESCLKHSGRFCLLLVESALLNVCDHKVSLRSS